MTLVPWRRRGYGWNPFYELERIQDEMNKLFNFSLSRYFPDRDAGLLEGGWNPAVDIYDSKDSILVKADIPGINRDEVEVTLSGNVLSIKGEKKKEKEVKREDYMRSERFYGVFNRTITLPAEVDESKVTATYKNGVLEIVLPKKEEAKPRRLKIDVK